MRTGCLILFSAALCAASSAAAAPVRIDVRAGEALSAVRDRVRALSERERVDGVEVVFAPGQYKLSGTLRLEAKDGGGSSEKPVVWRAEKPGTAHFTSARTVPAGRFRKVTDPEILKALPPENRGDTLVADVDDLLPKDWLPQFDVFLNGDFATLARWPNTGEFTSFTGRVDVGTRDKNGCYQNGAFVYSNPRAKRWNFSKGVSFYGYWTHDWASCSAVSRSYGTENGTKDVIRLATPVTYGVNQGTWGRKDRRFYAYDLLEELDAPREWWLDRTARKLYLIPENGALKPTDVIRLAPKAPTAVAANGLENFRLEGLAFEDHNGPGLEFALGRDITILACSFTGIGGTPTVKVEGTKRFRLANSLLRHLAGFGVFLRAGDRRTLTRADSVIENCRILDFGVKNRTYQGALEVAGCGHVIRNNEFAYAPHQAMRYEANETLIENNDIHHVLLETGDAGAIYTGRDATTQGNVIRHNFIHELGSEGADNSTMAIYFDDCDCGDAVYGNVIWKCTRGIMLGGGRDHPISGNVFAECNIGMSIDHRGLTSPAFYLKFKNEDHFQPGRMAKMKVTEEPWKSRYPHLANQMNDSPEHPYDNPVTSNVFLNCSAGLVVLDQSLTNGVLARMTFADNLAISTPAVVKPAMPDQRLAAAFDVRTNAVETGFADPFAGDFRLMPNSPVRAKLPTFDPGPRWFSTNANTVAAADCAAASGATEPDRTGLLEPAQVEQFCRVRPFSCVSAKE